MLWPWINCLVLYHLRPGPPPPQTGVCLCAHKRPTFVVYAMTASKFFGLKINVCVEVDGEISFQNVIRIKVLSTKWCVSQKSRWLATEATTDYFNCMKDERCVARCGRIFIVFVCECIHVKQIAAFLYLQKLETKCSCTRTHPRHTRLVPQWRG